MKMSCMSKGLLKTMKGIKDISAWLSITNKVYSIVIGYNGILRIGSY